MYKRQRFDIESVRRNIASPTRSPRILVRLVRSVSGHEAGEVRLAAKTAAKSVRETDSDRSETWKDLFRQSDDESASSTLLATSSATPNSVPDNKLENVFAAFELVDVSALAILNHRDSGLRKHFGGEIASILSKKSTVLCRGSRIMPAQW